MFCVKLASAKDGEGSWMVQRGRTSWGVLLWEGVGEFAEWCWAVGWAGFTSYYIRGAGRAAHGNYFIVSEAHKTAPLRSLLPSSKPKCF